MTTGPLIASVLGDFADAIDFVFRSREARTGAAEVGGSQFLELTWEHLKLSFAAVGAGVAVALPVGVWLGHTRRGSFVPVSVSNVGRAVPSIALIALFIAYFDWSPFGYLTLALTLLAIPPILTNAYVGVRQVDPETVDAARGMGMTGWQIARRVELPMALPLIFGGIRTSAVNVVATATIAPLAGVVTLGDPIINPSVYGSDGQLAAAIVVAVLAIATEVAFGVLQRVVTPAGLKSAGRGPRTRRLPIPARRVQST